MATDTFIVKDGKIKGVIIEYDEYEKIEELLDIGLAKAMDEAKNDKLISYDKIKH
ncbi:MAG: RelB Antitoxin alpha helical domain [Methanothermococcus sp.]|nr:RelB Antitoxin alpha helical domain [Methanothermococcus sp.]